MSGLYYRLRSALARGHIDRPWPTTRRGFKLWILSFIVGLLGINYILSPVPPSTAAALELPFNLMPAPWWGVLILALTGTSAFTSYCHRGRDVLGYRILAAFCACWAVFYLLSPLLLDGPTRAFSGFLTWLAICVFVLFSAGDVDQPLRTPRRRDRGDA